MSCPPEGAQWNMHPRVYLPIPPGATEVSCPYCGATYPVGGSKPSDPAPAPAEETSA